MKKSSDRIVLDTSSLAIECRLVPWDAEAFGFPVAQIDRLALNLTSRAMLQHPELARVATRAVHAVPRTQQRWTPPLWMKAAAVVMLAALTAMAGFWVGRAQPVSGAGSSAIASTAPVSPRKDSPWAKYRMGPDPLGNGIRVVRVDTMEQEVRP